MVKSEKVLLYCVKYISQLLQSFVVIGLGGQENLVGVKGLFFGFCEASAVFCAGLISKMAQNGLNQEKQGNGLK